MSSLALARKWRPRSFEALVGQEHAVKALSHALATQRLHHAYLLTGTRGVGKTTIARILAKALNCETGITASPCGKCGACTDIDAGRFPDYLEMDAASNRGVEEMAQVLDSAVYAPTTGRYKVFVIDEVHMLSNHAFNAMLKTLEEPPGHVIFILATTDPQKVPVTVLSRCLQFGLKNMSAQSVAEHLAKVLEAEQVPFESGALLPIGKAARGSMRDALSLLDQAIAFGAGSVKAADVRQMLGAIDSSDVLKVFDALASNDAAGVLGLAEQLYASNVGLDRVLQEMASVAHRLSLIQLNAPGEFDEDPVQMQALAGKFSAAELQVIYQVVLHGQRDLGLAPDELTGFSMTMVRLLAFRPGSVATSLAPSNQTTRTVAVPAEPVRAPQIASSASVSATPARLATPAASAANQATASVPRAAAFSPASAAVQPTVLDFDGNWPGLTSSIRASGMVKQVLLGSELLSVKDDTFSLRVPLKNWAEAASVAKVREALSLHFGKPIKVQIDQGQVLGPTAEKIASEERAELQASAEESIKNDRFVQSLITDLGGTIVPGSIRPAAKN